MSPAGRPPLDIGKHGRFNVKEIAPKVWVARCRYRGADGKTRPVQRQGPSQQKAIANLQDALDRQPSYTGSEITADTLVSIAADAWFESLDREVAQDLKSPETVRVYRSIWTNHMLPALGGLRCREATTPRLNGFLVALGRTVKPGQRKTAKNILSGLAGFIVRQGALDVNPVREVERISSGEQKQVRAMTLEEIARWLRFLEADEDAGKKDLYDLTLIMLATGCRISEALAIQIETDVDVTAGTILLDHRTRPVKGQGVLRVKRRGNKGEGVLLRVPSWAVTVCKRRKLRFGGAGPLFPSTTDTYRDPTNVLHAIAKARDAAGLGWVTSHSYRKTVATFLDRADLEPREIAAQLAHANEATTRRFYIAPRPSSGRAAEVLEVFDPAKIRGN